MSAQLSFAATDDPSPDDAQFVGDAVGGESHGPM